MLFHIAGESTVKIQITVKNYRCFDDANPLRIEINNGFIALVGPNNSGKSSCLKFFYEQRYLWEQISSNALLSVARGVNIIGVSGFGIGDPEEIFSDSNERNIVIEVKIDSSVMGTSVHPIINFVRATGDRSNPNMWTFEYYFGDNEQHIPKGENTQESVCWEAEGVLRVALHKFDYSAMAGVMKDLARILYVGPFRNAINEGAGNYFDLAIGTGFITTWSHWKTGGIKAQNRAIESITADIRQIFEFATLEINASEQLKTLIVSINGKSYKLSELGAGLAQFIIVFGNAAIKKPSFILVDEPELHLHPSLQLDFLTSLASYASRGIIYATHSLGLARSTTDKIYSFQKRGGRTIVKNFEQTPNYAEFLGELSFSAFKEMGCDRILLVEGVNDVKVIQQFLRKLKKDHRIVILPLGGNQLAKGGVEHELGEILRLTSNISAIVDSERATREANPKRERVDFQATCEKLGIDVLLTERRAIENYLSDTAIKAEFGEKYRALSHYELLSECEHSWNKNVNWKVARKMELTEVLDTDLGQFLNKL